MVNVSFYSKVFMRQEQDLCLTFVFLKHAMQTSWYFCYHIRDLMGFAHALVPAVFCLITVTGNFNDKNNDLHDWRFIAIKRLFG